MVCASTIVLASHRYKEVGHFVAVLPNSTIFQTPVSGLILYTWAERGRSSIPMPSRGLYAVSNQQHEYKTIQVKPFSPKLVFHPAGTSLSPVNDNNTVMPASRKSDLILLRIVLLSGNAVSSFGVYLTRGMSWNR